MFNLRHTPFEAYATVPNAFAPHQCETIRRLFTDSQSGTVGTGEVHVDIRDSQIQWLHYKTEYQWIFDRLATIIIDVNASCFGMDLDQTESIQLTEYDAGYKGFYGQHTDGEYGTGPSRNRKLSVTMQLTPPNEYEGGELKLYHKNFKEPFTAVKDLGTMTLFRSHIIHEVTPVTKGRRLSFVTWVRGPLPR